MTSSKCVEEITTTETLGVWIMLRAPVLMRSLREGGGKSLIKISRTPSRQSGTGSVYDEYTRYFCLMKMKKGLFAKNLPCEIHLAWQGREESTKTQKTLKNNIRGSSLALSTTKKSLSYYICTLFAPQFSENSHILLIHFFIVSFHEMDSEKKSSQSGMIHLAKDFSTYSKHVCHLTQMFCWFTRLDFSWNGCQKCQICLLQCYKSRNI